MPDTYSVSPAHPDKIVVNGTDLVNEEELSNSQKVQLQRYINEHAHLLGEKEDESKIRGNVPANLGSTADNYGYDRRLLTRTDSPASEYGGKRKGVSWSDLPQRARSHSPNSGDYDNPRYGANSNATFPRDFSTTRGRDRDARDAGSSRGKPNGGNRSDRVINPYAKDYPISDSGRDSGYGGRQPDIRSRTESPAAAKQPFKWDKWYSPYGSRDSVNDDRGSRNEPFSWMKERAISPAYSTLGRHPDDYNRFKTQEFRGYYRPNPKHFQWDDTLHFSGYGDHFRAGVQFAPKRWTGGEMVNDPSYIQKYKAIKPRRLFYSPIGDGVVEADGVEMKRPPPDLTPKREVIHQRVVEYQRGKPGHRVIENMWDTGGTGGGPYDGFGDAGLPDDGGRGKGLGDDGGRKPPYDDDDGGRRRGPPYDGGPPYDDGLRDAGPRDSGLRDAGPRDRGLTPMSDAGPREGWKNEFIVNPRELIYQYAHETPTTIFDLDDHTPKTITTFKETLVPDDEY
ncbi:Protein GEI-15 [Aphelenchoides avenae]|nr:Protein GEI-15 [Aphelenchus avenae]